jgi:hypothetical protein
MAVLEIQEAFHTGEVHQEGQNRLISLDDWSRSASGEKEKALNMLRIVNMLRAFR